jgi:serine/threonine protein phosphatase PrpC
MLILSTDGIFLVYKEQQLASMIFEMRQSGQFSLRQITQQITNECCSNYFCKDNVSLILVDLKKHLYDTH